jgi:LacI family transcriptional regulator
MATIYEVSALAGVSLATVSRVINNSGRVSDKTRQKVLSAMEQLNYRPNSIAQALASNRSNCVGVLVSELHGPFFGTMLTAIEDSLRRAGKFVIFAAGHSDKVKERDSIRFLISRNCDALILHVEAVSDRYLLEHRNAPTPFVLVNRSVPGMPEKCIALNNERGGYLATQYLLQMGHRDIAYVSGPLAWGDASDRLAGHKRALAEFGVRFDERLLYEGDYHELGGGNALNRLLDAEIPFSAIACANDEMAVGAMAVARDRGLGIPDDLSFVGFDNAPMSRFIYPRLSTIDYPIEAMSRMAVRWILGNIYREDGGDIEHLFEPSLLVRDSVSRFSGQRRVVGRRRSP